MASRGMSWASLARGHESEVNPLYLWGDDVQYNASHEKLVTVVMGGVLDETKFSMASVFPLFTIREVTV